MIKENEKLYDLMLDGLKIIQNEKEFMYGTDAVVLSDFASVKKNSKVLDLCCGSGIIPLLLYAKYRPENILGIEYFEKIADMARRSVEYNSLSEKINIVCGDVKNICEYISPGTFDYVTVNPPYMYRESGAHNENDLKDAARREILCDFSDVVNAADYALKFGGKLAVVHRFERLTDVLCEMRRVKIEPKRFSYVYSDFTKTPKLILVEGKKGAEPGLSFENPKRLEK